MATQASYSSVTIGASSTTIDSNHPYFLHPSDNPGMSLTTVILNEHNFSQWSRSMTIALSAKLKLGFVDGTYKPPAANSPLLVHWTRCNHMVISWLLNSVSPDIRNSVVYMSSGCVIWKDLETRYAQSNLPRLFSLRKDLSQLHQGTMTIASYYTKFKTLSDELENLVGKPRCTCNACTCDVNTKSDTYDQTIQITQFLMGLSDQFTAIRGQILLMKPVPSLSQCYSLLLQEENQREIHHSSSLHTNNLAMNVVKPSVENNLSPQSQRYGQVHRKSTSDPSLSCDYCHLTGHTRDKCFCLQGYPPWHKFYGKPKPKPKFARANNVTQGQTSFQGLSAKVEPTQNGGSNIDYNIKENCGLSTEQYKNLVHLLQTGMKNTGVTNTDVAGENWSGSHFPSANTVHFAGIIQPETSTSSFNYDIKHD